MNLIEQLGYEKAKNIHCGNAGDWSFYSISFDWYSDKFHEGHGMVNIEDIESELLDYRRQHNIYESGDLVVYRTLPYERLFSVRYVGGDEIVIYELWDEMGAKTFTEIHPYLDIRHAIDAEIEAGKRLDEK